MMRFYCQRHKFYYGIDQEEFDCSSALAAK